MAGGQIFGGGFGPIRKTSDGGLTWTVQYEPESEISPTGISFIDSANGWCSLWDQRQDPPPLSHKMSMLRTTDGGALWYEQYVGMQAAWGLSFDNNGHGCAVGVGPIMYSSDRGNNWIARSAGIYQDLNAVHVVDSMDVWAAGNEQTLLHTTDGGHRWYSLMNPAVQQNFRCITFVGKRHGWVAGGDMPIFYTEDGGMSWQQSPSAGNPYIRGITFVDTMQGWAVGDDLMHTTDGGVTWLTQDPFVGLLAIDFTDLLYGWAAGIGGRILATKTGGTSWFPQQSITANALTGIDFVDRLNGWAVGRNGTIVRTSNGGASWVQQNSRTTAWLWGVRFMSATLGWVVGDSGIVLSTTTGGETWLRESATTQNLLAIDVGYGKGWIAGSGATILHAEKLAGVRDWGSEVPLSVELLQNYPNPFNPETKVEFSLSARQRVSLKVFDILGRETTTLVDDVRPAGTYVVSWNSLGLSSGVYCYRLLVDGRVVSTKRMVLLR